MKNAFEEYGYTVIAALCGAILIGTIISGVRGDGFIGTAIINYVESVIGG